MASIRPPRGSEIEVVRLDGSRVLGTFRRMDDEFLHVRGTLGDEIGKDIFIPRPVIAGITVLAMPSDDELIGDLIEDF